MFRINVNGKSGAGKRFLISLGLTLIFVATCLIAFPKLFSYIFAGIFGLIGMGALLNGIFAKSNSNNSGGNTNHQSGNTEEGTYHELND